MKSANSFASESSRVADSVAAKSYEAVAGEYYDEQLHPTCADFRSASDVYLTRLFTEWKPSGRMADVGCGRSLITKFCQQNIVLIDQSPKMLEKNSLAFEKRQVDVEKASIGSLEFDWIFAVLGDPYNSPAAWRNIALAQKIGGECVFIVPSRIWARQFRAAGNDEKPDLARFVTSKGEVIFLRSLIFEPDYQANIITSAGLSLISIDHVLVRDLPFVRSPKIYKALSAEQSLLDVYRARKVR